MRQKIITILVEHRIDLSKYGQGEAKSLDSLLDEVITGESLLKENDAGRLIREVSIATSRITYGKPGGAVLRLKEDRQEFKDGRVRTRDEILGKNAISEKLKVGEKPTEAIIRAIRDEELRVGAGFKIAKGPVEDVEEAISQSFPGLKSVYRRFGFEVEFDDTAYNPSGYTEEQLDKTTYYIWVEEMEVGDL